MIAVNFPGKYLYETAVRDSIECAHNLCLPYESKCNGPHGHTYRIVAIVGADELDENLMVVDFVTLKKIIRRYDHTDLNTMNFGPTTAENFAACMFHELNREILEHHPNAHLLEVRISETESSVVSYRGRPAA